MSRKVFVLGDSISMHYGPYLKSMLPEGFEYDRERDVDQEIDDLDRPVGANGGDSREVLAFLRERRSRQVFYDILLVNCGLHDLRADPVTGANQVPLEAYGRNLRQISEIVNIIAGCAIWLRTTPVDDERHNTRDVGFERYEADVVQYNEVADQIMTEATIPAIDLHSFTKALGKDLYCDHVHFTQEVRALQAAFIAGYLHRIDSDAAFRVGNH